MIDQEFEDDPHVEAAKFLLNPDEDRAVDPETQARLEQLLQAAGETFPMFWPYYSVPRHKFQTIFTILRLKTKRDTIIYFDFIQFVCAVLLNVKILRAATL